jgi:preprotein translocase subunit SecE
MADVQVAPSTSFKDSALLILSIVAIIAGIAAFYWYDEKVLALRIGMVVAGLAVGAGLLWLSSYGRDFVQFAQAARVELRKVVWPGRTETIQTTYVVFGFAIVMGLFFFVLDWALTWMTRFLGGSTG